MDRSNLGPVFWWELRRVSRPWGFYAARAILVAGLLVGLGAVWWRGASHLDLTRPSAMRKAGEWYFGVIVLAQLSMVLLAAPAATAGSFCTELARGHVGLTLVTGVTAAEIVFGTLAARLLPVLGTMACVVPVLAVSSHLGGIAPTDLVRLEIVTVGCAVVGCTLALVMSIGARRLHEVLVTTYALLVAWVLGYPTWLMIQVTSLGRWLPGGWTQSLRDINPYWLILGPVWSPGAGPTGGEWEFLAGTAGLAMGLAALAAWRLRPTALESTGRPPRRSSFVFSRMAAGGSGGRLDSHPVYWRECRLQRPSRWLGLLWGLYIAGALVFTALAVGECAARGVRRTGWAGPFNGFQTAVGLLLLSLVTPAALAEDRARGILDLLLSTPLSSRSLVLEKWWAYYRAVPILTLLPAIVAAAHAVTHQRWLGVVLVAGMVLAQGAAVTSLGLALATWLSRPDRALVVSAAASILVTVAWVPLVVFLFRGSDLSLGLASASPLLGVGLLTTEMEQASVAVWPVRVIWAVFWILASSGLALGLLQANLATFDRCLGRITPRTEIPQPVGDRHGPGARRHASFSGTGPGIRDRDGTGRDGTTLRRDSFAVPTDPPPSDPTDGSELTGAGAPASSPPT